MYKIGIILLLFNFSLQGQLSESLYDSVVINQLKSLYEEKEELFYSCVNDRSYTSLAIGTATFIDAGEFTKDSSKDLIDNKPDLEVLKKKMPGLKVFYNVPVVRHQYVDYKGNVKYRYTAYTYLKPNTYNGDKYAAKGYLVDGYHSSNGMYHRNAIWLNDDFANVAIPQKYADLINYIDCVISPESKIFTLSQHYPKAPKKHFYLDTEIDTLMSYVSHKVDLPQLATEKRPNSDILSRKSIEKNRKIRTIRKRMQLDWVSKYGSTDTTFLNLYHQAKYSDYDNYQSDFFEEMVNVLDGPEAVLQLKRSRVVHGSCSMDNKPVNHLKNIAKYAVLANNWNVFVRSHMDIVNDRFSSVVYSNYGEMSRNTPIIAFVKIGMNLAKLFCGSILTAADCRKNHYQSGSQRIGRAISNLQNPQPCLSILRDMIKDDHLDIHNRMIAWHTLASYISHTKGDILSEEMISLLSTIDKEMALRVKRRG